MINKLKYFKKICVYLNMQLSKVLFALLSLQSFLSVDSFIKKPLVPIRLIKKQITMNESPNSGNHDESDFPLTIKYYVDI